LAAPATGPAALRADLHRADRAGALDAFAEFSTTWEAKYPAIARLWTTAWAEMVPFLGFDVEIRRIVCSTNAIESINARFRRAVNARGHFPTEQSALKVLYLTICSLDPTGKGRARWSNRWKPVSTPSTAPSPPAAANNSTTIDLTQQRYTVKATVPQIQIRWAAGCRGRGC
jgi:hypothetical protein